MKTGLFRTDYLIYQTNKFSMKHFSIIIRTLALCLVLVGCNSKFLPSQSTSSASSVNTAASQKSENSANCPSQDFNTFLKSFADDASIQKAFVTNPLQSEFIDTSAQPEPRSVTKMLSIEEVQFPLMPSIQQQTKDGLVATQIPLNIGEISVKLAKEDTDYQMTFFFRKNDGCWKLYRLKNDSL